VNTIRSSKNIYDILEYPLDKSYDLQ
jgi:hypothetical protein